MIVYSRNVNHCQYSVSTLNGFGLWVDDIISIPPFQLKDLF